MVVKAGDATGMRAIVTTASSPQEARRRFGEIQWDGKGVSIGPYRIERKQYENHR